MENKLICPSCGHALHRKPYLMSARRELPLLSFTWALATITALLAVCLLASRLLG